MGEPAGNERKIRAKIVYYGPAGAGKTANAEYIHRKLKREHRGRLRKEHVAGNPEAVYEVLPVNLGTVQGYETELYIHTVPGGPAQADTRRALLDGADGIVFVADPRPERHDATVESFKELREHLRSYGRSIDDLMLLVQYNQRDLAGENDLDGLHRRLKASPSATFEAVASEGTGVLQTLTTASKFILAQVRRRDEAEPPPVQVLTEVAEQEVSDVIDSALPELSLDDPAKGFRIESAGPAEGTPEGVRVPIRLIDEASGRRLELCLRLSIESA